MQNTTPTPEELGEQEPADCSKLTQLEQPGSKRMSSLERLHRIKYMIQSRTYVPIESFLDELEISQATFKRDLEYLRSRFGADIGYDRFHGGYYFKKPMLDEKKELPGLWFTEKEATALVLMQHLLANLDKGGLIGPHIDPLKNIIESILGNNDTTIKELRKRIRVFGMSARKSSIENFEEVGHALLKRQRLQITHYSRAKDETTEREVSPQRLIFYKDNWYLDCYCHLRKDLRSFAVDGIKQAAIVYKRAEEIAERQLNEFFSESYGIFSGRATQRVKLKFTPERARWVAFETWHGEQVASFDKEGNYLLEFDYNQDPELIMDILQQGAAVEVLSPAALRSKIKAEIKKMADQYG